jgi:WD40 repeat protein
LWDLSAPKQDVRSELDWAPIALCFSRTGNTLWGSVGGKNRLVSWKMPELAVTSEWNDRVSDIMKGRNRIADIAVGSQWVIVGSGDSTTKLFRTADGKWERQWPSPGGFVHCVALSADESLAVSGTQNGRVQVVRVPEGEVIADLAAHRDAVWSVALSGDGRMLATASGDRTVRLWQRKTSSFEEVVTLRCAGGPVSWVGFSPDERKLFVLVRNEAAVRIWHLDRLRARLAQMDLDW